MSMSAARRPRLLALGDAWVPTGFARVAESVLTQLARNYEIDQWGLNYRGQKHDVPWRVRPTSEDDLLGIALLPDLVAELRPDVIWALGDLWMQAEWLECLSVVADCPPTVVYMPVDSAGLDPDHIAMLGNAHTVVVYTGFSRRVLVNATLTAGLAPAARPVEVIPHGVDVDRFVAVNRGVKRIYESELPIRQKLRRIA